MLYSEIIFLQYIQITIINRWIAFHSNALYQIVLLAIQR
jgi:hypothetical protein